MGGSVVDTALDGAFVFFAEAFELLSEGEVSYGGVIIRAGAGARLRAVGARGRAIAFFDGALSGSSHR